MTTNPIPTAIDHDNISVPALGLGLDLFEKFTRQNENLWAHRLAARYVNDLVSAFKKML